MLQRPTSRSYQDQIENGPRIKTFDFEDISSKGYPVLQSSSIKSLTPSIDKPSPCTQSFKQLSVPASLMWTDKEPSYI